MRCLTPTIVLHKLDELLDLADLLLLTLIELRACMLLARQDLQHAIAVGLVGVLEHDFVLPAEIVGSPGAARCSCR